MYLLCDFEKTLKVFMPQLSFLKLRLWYLSCMVLWKTQWYLFLNMQHSAGYLLGSQIIHKGRNKNCQHTHTHTDLFPSIPGCNQLFWFVCVYVTKQYKEGLTYIRYCIFLYKYSNNSCRFDWISKGKQGTCLDSKSSGLVYLHLRVGPTCQRLEVSNDYSSKISFLRAVLC